MTVQPRSIAAMQNYGTAYELAIYDRDGKMVKVIGYFVRKTRSTIVQSISDHGKFIEGLLTASELDMDCSYSSAKGFVFGNGAVSIRFTGRTERDAAQAIGKLN